MIRRRAMMGRSVAGWTPAEITTVVWLDASDADTVTLNSGVQQWSDKSGNGFHATQATASLRPAYTTQINNLNVVTFTNHYLINTVASRNTDIRSDFIVFRENTTVNYAGVISWIPLTGSDHDQSDAYTLNSGGGSHIFAHEKINSSNVLIVSGTGVSPLGIYAGSRDTGTDYVFHNASQVTSGTSAGAGTAGNGFLIGGRYLTGAVSANYRLNGDVAEIVSTALVDITTRQKIEGYLAHKWGLTALLPANHPYKNSAP